MVTIESPLIRDISLEDMGSIRPILETWIRDSETGEINTDEVSTTLRSMQQVSEGDQSRIYVVAEGTGGLILGVMGLREPCKELEKVSDAVAQGNAIELINAFVSPDARGRGIGSLLVRELEVRARLLACDEILVKSGPRYQETGWHFWQSLYGDPIATLSNAYGPGNDAPVWLKATGYLG